MQYFRPSLSYNLSLRSLFYLFWSDRRHVLLYKKSTFLDETDLFELSPFTCKKIKMQNTKTKFCPSNCTGVNAREVGFGVCYF